MENVRNDKPFFFWYGASEPHRAYEQDSWKRTDKKLSDVNLPGFFPDHEIVRGDMLDYAVEIEWFDMHLERMLNYLEEIGELENTIVIVTADNGMPFPRAKANCYEYGIHVPLAIRYPKEFPGGRVVDDLISFSDFAPTFLEITQTSQEGMLPVSGKSFLHILRSKKQGIVDESRRICFCRPGATFFFKTSQLGLSAEGCPQPGPPLIWNMKPERWPAGAPQRINPGTEDELLPMYGIDENGEHVSEWAFTDIDAAPTKSYIIENMEDDAIRPYFDWAHAKRPEFELFDIKTDPYNLTSLAGDPAYAKVENELKDALLQELTKSGDPRVVGPDKEVFDSYIRYSPMREFPEPDRIN
jgi:N-sulfoglucosamine sulfohydrolase